MPRLRPPRPSDVAEAEAFFAPHTDQREVTLTPFADGDTARAFFAEGYRFVDFEAMLAQTVERPPEVRHEVIEVGEDDEELFLEASAHAWRGEEDGPVEPSEFARASVRAARRDLAFVDGVPAAVG